ncbi:MAG: two-component regulator propeller domain-containing protein [Candidatus Cryptobacteroides sp.]
MKHFLSTLIAILTLPALTISAADNFQIISSRDGISNNAILTLCQDDKGYIWMGTCDGLNRWDGNEMRIYPYDWEGAEDLSGRFIGKIVKTADGLFVINNNHGVDIFDPVRLKVRKHPEITFKRKIAAGDSRHIFLAAKDSIFIYAPDQDRFLAAPAPSGYDFATAFDINVAADGSLCLFDIEKGIMTFTVEMKDDRPQFKLKSLRKHDGIMLAKAFNDGGKTFLFYREGPLYEYTTDTEELAYIFNLGDETYYRGWPSGIVRAGDDIIVTYPTTGALRLKNEKSVPGHYIKENLDINCGVFTAVKDSRQNIVWFGTDGKGLIKMSDSPYKLKAYRIDRLKENIRMPVRSLYYLDGHLWFGTKGDGLLDIYDSGKDAAGDNLAIRRFTVSNSDLAENSVYAISSSSRPLLWIGNNSSTINYYSFRDNRLHSIYTKGVLDCVHGIYESSPDSLWISTTSKGVFLATVEGGDYPHFRDIQEIELGEQFKSDPMFFAMYPQGKDRLWFGHKGQGAASYDIRTGQTCTYDLSILGKLTYNDVYAITSDENGNIWFGTGEGVIRMWDSGMELIEGTRGAIHAIANDGKGCIWASGNSGLSCISAQEGTVKNYGYSSGLETVEFSDGAMYVDNEETIWFGGIDGIVRISCEADTPHSEYHPTLEFREMDIDGALIPICNLEKDGTVILGHDQMLTRLVFGAIDYINGQDYVFRWRIRELQDYWRESGNSIEFTRLRPGNYTVDVCYNDKATGYTSGISTITIRVRAPWYSSVLAKICYILITLLGAILLTRHFILRNRKRKAMRQEAMKEDFRKRQQDSVINVLSDIAEEFSVPITLIYGNCRLIMEKDRMQKHFPAEINSILQNTIRLKNLSSLIDGIGSKNESVMELLNVSELTDAIVSPFRQEAERNGCSLTVDIPQSIIWGIEKKNWSIATNLIAGFLVQNTAPHGNLSMSLNTDEDNLKLILSSDNFAIGKNVIDSALAKDGISRWEEKSFEGLHTNRFSIPILNELLGRFNASVTAESPKEHSIVFIINVARNAVSNAAKVSRSSEFVEEEVRFPVSGYAGEQKIFDTSKSTLMVINEGDSVSTFIVNALADTYNISFPESSEKALEMLEKHHPDLIICGSGNPLLKKVKENKVTNHIPVILIVFGQRQNVRKEDMTLADACLPIPFEIDTLRTTISQLISRNKVLKAYYLSPMGNYKMSEGKMLHNEDKEFVDKIYKIIYQNVSNPDLSPKFIAEEMGLSLRNLYRRTESLMDTKISALIKDYRLSVAANLLTTDKMAVDEVIYKTGFVNRGTFFRLFSEKYGMTPKKYMNRPRKDEEDGETLH